MKYADDWWSTWALIALLVVSGTYLYLHRTPDPPRYIDYCGHSVFVPKTAAEMLPLNGITPLFREKKEVPAFALEGARTGWLRPATADELRTYRWTKVACSVWIVPADAPPVVHLLARQYQCLIKEWMDRDPPERPGW